MRRKPRIHKPAYYNPRWHYLDRSNGIWLSLQDHVLWVLSHDGLFLAFELQKHVEVPKVTLRPSGVDLANIAPKAVYCGSYPKLPNLAFNSLVRRHACLLKPNHLYIEESCCTFGYKDKKHTIEARLEDNKATFKSIHPKPLQSFWATDPGFSDWLKDYVDWFVQTNWLPNEDWQDPRTCLALIDLLGPKLSPAITIRLYQKLVTQFNTDESMALAPRREVIGIGWWLAHPEVAKTLLAGARSTLNDNRVYINLDTFVKECSLKANGQPNSEVDLPWFSSGLAVERTQTITPDRPPQSLSEILAYIWYNTQKQVKP